MYASRRTVVIAVAAVAVLGIGLLVALTSADDGPEKPAGPRVVQPGAPGQSGRTLAPHEVQSVLPPRHTPADTEFFKGMIQHHAQALEMAAMVKERTSSSDVPLLAERITVSQRDEIAQMQGWLTDRGESLPQPHNSHAGHGTLMPGMLSDQQLTQLAGARNKAFDRLFLEFMIHHHQGALVMVQRLYANGGGIEPASDRFAREVNADQTIEIRRMQEMLTKLG